LRPCAPSATQPVAEVSGIFAASHTPVMLNFPDLISAAELTRVREAFVDLGRRMAAARPDAVVVVSDDHLHNFFLNNLPAFAIGAGDRYDSPIESWLKADKRVLPGHPGLGAHLIGEALEADFDPALCMQLTLDHGTLTPLELSGLDPTTPVVPVLLNCTQPPLPTMRRCFQFGRFLGRAIARYPNLDRVVVLATGGLSHDVGTPRMGMVNAEFDRTFLSLLQGSDDQALIEFAQTRVHEAGNGAEEIRMWLVAHGVADGAGAGLEVIHYEPLESWYCGIGLAEWKRGA
jgi:aromatic ring-opening dioxygenase catalytic subunit (LigB family)